MDEKLKSAAETGDINLLYASILEDPYVLDRIDHKPYFNTPLHIAASLGHTKFAMEIMRLKPSFSKKPNQDGFTPMHIGLQNEKTKLVNRFVDFDSELVRVQGREGKTPLHFVTEEGNIHLLSRFLSASPQSILDVTIHGETALHIAVKNFKFDAFDFLVGRLRTSHHEGAKVQETTVLNWKDEEGNTVLHVAALTNQPQVVSVLLHCGVDISAENSEGLTALQISQQQTQVDTIEIKKMLETGDSNASLLLPCSCISKLSLKKRLLIYFLRFKRNMKEETRNVQLVVAVLITTASYQASMSPPGGVWQDNNDTTYSKNDTIISLGSSPSKHDQGKAIMGTEYFIDFWLCNTMANLITTLAIAFLLPGGHISTLLLLSIFLSSYGYAESMFLISPIPMAEIVRIVQIALGPFFVAALIFSYKLNKKLK